MSQLAQRKEHFTYSDYQKWDESIRYELIDGVPYALAAPSISHQRIHRKLTRILTNFLEGKTCELFYAPTDVRLNPFSDDDTVFQPDIFVVCDQSKLDERSCNGAPDFVIEISLPTTAHFDMFDKYQKYLKAGVKEYWTVNPVTKTINVFILKNGKYIPTLYGENDIIPSVVLEGCNITLSEVFE